MLSQADHDSRESALSGSSQSIPTPSSLDLERRHGSGVYHKRPISIVRGCGAYLEDEAGKRYLDCISGIGVSLLGHANPEISARLAGQSQQLITCPELLGNPLRARYQSRLLSTLPAEMDRVFLCNSGTEAVEAAMKFARLSTGRREILALEGGFHGRSMGALSATWNPAYRRPFEPLVPEIQHLSLRDSEQAAGQIDESTAAVLIEIVQGEGGVRPVASDSLQMITERTRAVGALLIVDEVQTGFGRTGTMWAFEHHDFLTPDLLCLGKAIAAGLPMGAVAIGREVDQLPPGCHGSTFGGNPLACALGDLVLEIMERDELVERAANLGAWIKGQLTSRDLPIVREVRGAGLMIGIELRTRSAPALKCLAEEGVLALSAGPNVLRLMPPLTLSEGEAVELIHALDKVLGSLSEGLTRPGRPAEDGSG